MEAYTYPLAKGTKQKKVNHQGYRLDCIGLDCYVKIAWKNIKIANYINVYLIYTVESAMTMYQKELARIKEILRFNPRGMTITDISKEININRNSVAKYLDVLLTSGYVEMRALGPARVFYLSHRAPISALLNFSSDYILVLDNDLNIIQVNDNLLNLMNTEREAILGRGIESSLNPILGQEVLLMIKEALNGKGSKSEIRFQTAEVEFFFNINIIPTTFDDGSQGVTLWMEDIAERKRAEEELRRSREEYIAVTNLTGDIIVRNDEEGRRTFLNEGACKFWGKPRDELLGVNFADYLHPDDAEKTTATIQEMIKTKQMVRGLINRQKTPKGWRLVEWNSAPIFNEAGNYIGMQSTGRDITERKEMEEKLHKIEAKTQAILNTIPDLMLLISKDGTFLDFKAAPSSEFLGKKVHEVIPAEFAQKVMHYIKRTLQTGDTQIFEYQSSLPLQSRNLRDYEVLIVAIDEKKVLAIVRDITERKATFLP